MLLNKVAMGAPTSTIFKYIVKEKSKNVILISDSDEETEATSTVNNILPTTSSPPTTKKRKRSIAPVHGNLNDPIALDDSDDEEVVKKEQRNEELLTDLNNMNTMLISTTAEEQEDIVKEEVGEEEDEEEDHMDVDINPTPLLSPLSEYATMSESELSFARDITEDTEMIQVKYTHPPPPTTVDTIPSNDNASLLRYLELYIQSVTDIPTIPIETQRSSRRSRLTTDHPQDTISPYVPNRVWYNSTWEDWAQLDVNDVLHIPFTSEESLLIQNQVAKQVLRKNARQKDLVDFWQYVSTLLPGRTPLDCRCFWQDFIDGGGGNYNKSIMIGRQKQELRNNSRHQLVSKRNQSGFLNYNAIKKIHLASMSRESIISEGSGDAISLAIFHDQINGIRVAVGSLCDENTQYNMPGNLRLWTSDNENCLSLRGHKTPNEENGQDIWRTVTDVKLSKDQSLIYSASHDGCANIWKANTGKLVSTLQYHCKPINQLAVSYSAVENNVLATCSNDGTATIWSVSPNGKTGSGMICELDTKFYSDPCVDCIDFGHGASEDMLFLGINNQDLDHPGYIDVFDATKGASKIRFDSMMGCVSALAISTTGRCVVSGNYNRYDNMAGDGFLHLHDIRHAKSVTKFYSGHPDVNIVAISPCERYVASGNADKEKGEVLVFDVRSGRKILHKLSHDQTLVNQSLIAPDSSIGIGGFYWTSDSRTILTGGGDSTVKVWGVEGATRLLKSYPTSNCVTSLTVHEESMTIAAGVAGAQGIVHVWRP
ncbi:unnamed protein product [Mucor hiemalis]